MARCGNYELDRAIGWGRRSTYFAARVDGAGGPPEFVIRRARTVDRRLSHAFMRAAAEQQAAVGAGCRRLAPIHAFDCDESGFAYYATIRYETSLAEFLEAGCKVDSDLLREIVTGVLGSLAELHEISRRAHGNLTPGNILLDSQELIHLTDLAPSAKDATTADDLFALGTLIYQLVRRTARIGTLNPPLDYSPEWTESLDDDAEGWREFTNRLLTKSRNTGPEALAAAARDLKSLASLAARAAVTTMPQAGDAPQPEVRRAPPKKRSPLPKIAAIILLLAGGGGGVMWWKNNEDKKNARIAQKREDDRIAQLQAAEPPAIKMFRAELKQPLPVEIADDTKLKPLLDRIARSLDRAGSKDEVTLVLGNWDAPDKMKARAAAWRSAPREWTRLAGQLEAAAKIDVDGEKSIIEQLQKAIAARDAADELERVWGDVTSVLKSIAADKSRVMPAEKIQLLPDFTLWAVEEILSAKNLTEGQERAQGALGELSKVLAFLGEKAPRVVWGRIGDDAAAVITAPKGGIRPDRWIREAERLVGPTGEKRGEWEKILEEKKTRILNLPKKDQLKWDELLKPENKATSNALESEVAAIDKRLGPAGVFKGLRTPEEEDYDKYGPILKQFGESAASAADIKEATAALDAFRLGTRSPNLVARYSTDKIVNSLNEALAMPDKMTLAFTKPNDWVLVEQSPAYAIYKYKNAVPVPFLPLPNTRSAMAAIETPLRLAKLLGSQTGWTAPGAGPQIRTATMDRADDWLWPAANDFLTRSSVTYFPGNDKKMAGDVGSDSVPVTWLSFTDATKMAGELGGRLPTPAEWKAAYNQAGSVQRLRSSAWTNQLTRTNSWPNNPGRDGCKPDSGSFSKEFGLVEIDYKKDTAAVAGATDDRALWLKSVFPDGKVEWKPGDKFLNLVGNAAEWVNNNGKAGIMGGSVVSPKSLPVDAVLTPPGKGAYFDVTFRLVVELGPGGAGEGLKTFKEAVQKRWDDFQASGPPNKQ